MSNTIQSYDLLKRIGSGGMATVYMARHMGLDRLVAIKIVKGTEKNKLRRLEREAMLSATLRQENLPSIYDYFVDGTNNHCLVMEFVDGQDLSTILKIQKKIHPAIAAMIIREVARGLEHIHDANIIHRDIKPSNIRISTEGRVILMDFGIAKQEDETQLTNLTSTGIIIGTPSYMSPEQAVGDKLNNQSDIFSLGIMLYEMLTGEKPFSADSNVTLISLIAQCRLDPIETKFPELPLYLCKVVNRTLNKEPRQRYQTAGQLVKDLNRFLCSMTQTEINEYLEIFYKHTIRKDKSVRDNFDDIPVNAELDEGRRKSFLSFFKRKKRPDKKPFRVLSPKVAVLLMLLAGIAGLMYFMFWWQPDYGKVGLAFKNHQAQVPAEARFEINGEEIGASSGADGKFVLTKFKKGRNALRVTYPLMYEVSEFSFVLDSAREGRNFVIDLNEELSAYRAANRKFRFVVSTNPQGAFVYLNEMSRIFAKTPSEDLWPNISPGSHILTFRKKGYKPLQFKRAFHNNQDLHFHVELQKITP